VQFVVAQLDQDKARMQRIYPCSGLGLAQATGLGRQREENKQLQQLLKNHLAS
jgi:hypothetical protein